MATAKEHQRGSCLQKLEETWDGVATGASRPPSGTLTLNLTHLSFWVCSSSETPRLGGGHRLHLLGSGRETRKVGWRSAISAILHLGCFFFFTSAPNPPLAFIFKSKSSHRMPDTSLPQPAGSISAQAPERACTRCRLSHSCFPCNRLSSPRIPRHIRLDLGHVSSV